MVRACLFTIFLAILPGGAVACRLALVLAIDVSSSVDTAEDALQRGGLANALVAPSVMDAFFTGSEPVALAVYEWSGRFNQADLLEWTMIETEADLLRAADVIRNSQRSHDDFPTAMGYALGYGARKIERGPACLFRTLDIAGDGISNDGFTPQQAYDAFPLDDVTVNGLVVNAGDFEGETELIPFFREQVIRGPGAFIEVAQGFADYSDAMERKLIRELGVFAIGGHGKTATAG